MGVRNRSKVGQVLEHSPWPNKGLVLLTGWTNGSSWRVKAARLQASRVTEQHWTRLVRPPACFTCPHCSRIVWLAKKTWNWLGCVQPPSKASFQLQYHNLWSHLSEALYLKLPSLPPTKMAQLKDLDYSENSELWLSPASASASAEVWMLLQFHTSVTWTVLPSRN